MTPGRVRSAELVAAVLFPTLVLGFVVAERLGFSDWWFGHDYVLEIATRFETSYAPDVDRLIGADEAGWKPLLRLISKYSTADFRTLYAL